MARRPYSSGGADARDIQSLVNAFLQLDPRARVIVVVLLAIAGVVALAFYERNIHQQSSAAVANPNLLLGNPSGATADPFNRSNYLLNKPYFAIGYNADNGTPNWVSWRVTSDDLGHAPRKQLFEADESLPSSFYHVTQHDYSGSGFDRGHMCPHGDRTANTDMSYATFVMTNVIPQAPNVNRKAWEQLESYSRELVERQHAHLYIMAGPCGRGGVGSEGPRETIGRGRVVVPAECWKIIVVVYSSAGGDDLARIDPTTRVISVIMPNDNTQVGDEWAGFRTSPAQIELKTGLHFFDRVPTQVAAALRQKVDREPIPPPVPHHFND
jgi:endonuclease G, mitochondrial